ncbi:MAG: hypothetical protein JWO36_2676 [Myxococcales bacterium]|nr:hypothetical protein [Myxococcales bacterium]
MRGCLLTGALLAGCVDKMSFEPVVEPGTCTMQVALDGSTGTAQTVGPLALGINGADICMHLDATRNTRVHFAAATAQEPGPASSYLATLEDRSFHAIVDGWDVSIGNTDTHTFMNLEWDPPAGQTSDVILWVRGLHARAPTTISLSLFDPLE